MLFTTKRSFASFPGFINKLHIEDELFNYKTVATFTDKYDQVFKFTFFDITYKLEDIKKRPDFTDFVSYGHYINRGNTGIMPEVINVFNQATAEQWTVRDVQAFLERFFRDDYDGIYRNNNRLINLGALTFLTKHFSEGIPNILSGTRMFKFFFPYKTCNFSDAVIVVTSFPKMEIDSNVSIIGELNTSKILFHPSVVAEVNKTTGYPELVIEGPNSVKADEKIELKIKLVREDTKELILDQEIDLFLELINGYSPYTRLTIKKGVATLPVRALDMNRGDTIKVKVGYRYYTGITTKSITVL